MKNIGTVATIKNNDFRLKVEDYASALRNLLEADRSNLQCCLEGASEAHKAGIRAYYEEKIAEKEQQITDGVLMASWLVVFTMDIMYSEFPKTNSVTKGLGMLIWDFPSVELTDRVHPFFKAVARIQRDLGVNVRISMWPGDHIQEFNIFYQHKGDIADLDAMETDIAKKLEAYLMD